MRHDRVYLITCLQLGPERRPTEGLVATPQDMQGVRERLQAWGKWDVTLEALAHVH